MHLKEWFKNTSIVPLSPKNLRISALLIAIYQMLISNVVLFVMLLGLAHAEEMKVILCVDIADQKQSEEYYELPTNSKGESLNQVRFESAKELASVTLLMLYVGTAIASIYLISCVSLFIGIYKNKPELMLPWMILDFIGVLLVLAILVSCSASSFQLNFTPMTQYWMICLGFVLVEILVWLVVHAYYLNLRQMRKLTEIATVAIPMPPPGTIPFHYRKENMYLGSGGYKHLLTDHDPNQDV